MVDMPSVLEGASAWSRRGDHGHPDAAVAHRRGHPSADELRETAIPAIGVVVLSQHADPATPSRCSTTAPERRAYLLKERVHNRAS